MLGPLGSGPGLTSCSGGSWALSPPVLQRHPGAEEAGPQDPEPGHRAGLPGGRVAGADERHRWQPHGHLHSPGHPGLGGGRDGLAPGDPDHDGECGPRPASPPPSGSSLGGVSSHSSDLTRTCCQGSPGSLWGCGYTHSAAPSPWRSLPRPDPRPLDAAGEPTSSCGPLASEKALAVLPRGL